MDGPQDKKSLPPQPSKEVAENKDKMNKGANPKYRNIILVRHGATALNEGEEKIRGWKDVPLNEHGHEEAKVAGKKLKGLVDAIVSSDLIRTKQTAKHISDETGAPIVAFSKALRPWNVGVFTSQPVKLILQDLYTAAKRSPNDKIPEGESFNDFKDRFLKEIQVIEKAFPNKRVAVVAHHRNERMYEAWKKKGAPDNYDFDWDTFAQKGIPPGEFKIE